MSQRRWQPPPMETPAEAKPKVTVDEQVVRKMLKVNPELRKGRTTYQVKKSLEQGAPVAQSPAEAAPGSATPPTSDASGQLQDAVDFFVRGKMGELKSKRAEILARRKALDADEQQLAATYREQVVSFVSLLDASTVERHGRAALAKHAEFLGEVGLTPAALVDLLRKNRGRS
ncbi:MAG: hypothetical protein HYZ27_02035 [Deltaproteobacteria bacterium]|nr:hypothetical protein [Deltaproteobacteria bacterium]